MNRLLALIRPASFGARGICVLALAVPVWLASAARAQNVLGPASDLLVTPAQGSTIDEHFDAGAGGAPLPAGFFGAGSDAFNGTIRFHGRPLEGLPLSGPGTIGLPGQADTIVRRLTTAPLPACPSSATIPIEIVALNLISVNPISVTFGGGASVSRYEVRGCLSSTVPQTQGTMQITKSNFNGGQFSSTLPVRPRLIFTKCTGTAGVASIVMDPAPPIFLNANGMWAYNNLGLPIASAPGGGSVDHDCNTLTPMVPFPPTSNFVVGVERIGATCTAPGGAAQKRLTPEQEMLAEHGVLPPCQPPGIGICFGDGTGIACPCGNIGAAGHGCEHSSGFGGGLLFGSGEAKLAADTLVLRAESLPLNTIGLFFQGTAALGGGFGIPFGDGIRCAGGAVIRLSVKQVLCGKVNHGGPVGDLPISVGGAIPAAGGTFIYQFWFRDAFPFCTPSTFNLTNGYSVFWS